MDTHLKVFQNIEDEGLENQQIKNP